MSRWNLRQFFGCPTLVPQEPPRHRHHRYYHHRPQDADHPHEEHLLRRLPGPDRLARLEAAELMAARGTPDGVVLGPPAEPEAADQTRGLPQVACLHACAALVAHCGVALTSAYRMRSSLSGCPTTLGSNVLLLTPACVWPYGKLSLY